MYSFRKNTKPCLSPISFIHLNIGEFRLLVSWGAAAARGEEAGKASLRSPEQRTCSGAPAWEGGPSWSL